MIQCWQQILPWFLIDRCWFVDLEYKGLSNGPADMNGSFVHNKKGTGLLRDKIEFVCSGGIQDEIYVCVRYSWLCLLLQKDAGGV